MSVQFILCGKKLTPEQFAAVQKLAYASGRTIHSVAKGTPEDLKLIEAALKQ